MPRIALLVVMALALGRVGDARAQQQGVAVQLPTFSFFSVNTSVIVPDSGAGIRAALARQAAQRQHQALPGECRAYVAKRQIPSISKTRPAADDLAGQLNQARRSSAGRGSASVAAIREQNRARQAETQREAEALLAKAAAAESSGKSGLARIYRDMAARRGRR